MELILSLSLYIWINILIWFKHGDDNGIIMGCCKLAWMFTLWLAIQVDWRWCPESRPAVQSACSQRLNPCEFIIISQSQVGPSGPWICSARFRKGLAPDLGAMKNQHPRGMSLNRLKSIECGDNWRQLEIGFEHDCRAARAISSGTKTIVEFLPFPKTQGHPEMCL